MRWPPRTPDPADRRDPAVRREVPGAGEVIAAHCTAHDYDDPGKPAIAWDDAAAREQLVERWSAMRTGCWGICPSRSWPAGRRGGGAAGAIAARCRPVGTPTHRRRWRMPSRSPRIGDLDRDPDARHVHKSRSRRQTGSGACGRRPDSGIITGCALTSPAAPTPKQRSDWSCWLARITGDGFGRFCLRLWDFRAELAERGHADRVNPHRCPAYRRRVHRR